MKETQRSCATALCASFVCFLEKRLVLAQALDVWVKCWGRCDFQAAKVAYNEIGCGVMLVEGRSKNQMKGPHTLTLQCVEYPLTMFSQTCQ